MQYIWPEIFTTKDISNRTDAALCADGLTAWANCMAGAEPVESFGEVLVLIGEQLGISPTAENLNAYADKWLANTTSAPTTDTPGL